MRVAINGAGIAGPSLAYWLQRFGHEPVLIEKAVRPREGGYVIDFWGAGYEVAERMGLIPELRRKGYDFAEVRWVDPEGRTSGSLCLDVFRRLNQGRFISLERSEVASSLHRSLDGKVETLFGDSIRGIEDRGDRVQVEFEKAPPRDFDLVVGADGLHSRVREMAFGPMDRFEKDLGFCVAAFEVAGYERRDELVFISHSKPGRQVSRLSKRDDKTVFLFVYRDKTPRARLPQTDDERKAAIERAYVDVGWECPRILEALRGAEDIYFDRVSQIVMPQWTKGRTALVGDAAAAVSLLAGEGAGLAMVESYVLAGELSQCEGDIAPALRRYEQQLMPFLRGKQKSALKIAWTYAPETTVGIKIRDLGTRLFNLPFVAKLGINQSEGGFRPPVYEGWSA
ncbi:MAG: FAD-binding domain [Acidobacteria bacterium]|nr:FAD-binding domain [Acidobacteriota bacterium]